MVGNRGAPPAYMIDREDTLAPSPWDVKHWGWKKWALIAGGIVVLIVVIIIAVEVTKKNNAYPNYSPLSYKLADTCTHLLTSNPSLSNIKAVC